jgi:uncharacterized protein
MQRVRIGGAALQVPRGDLRCSGGFPLRRDACSERSLPSGAERSLDRTQESHTMNCPRCPESILEEREREGVTVDACRSCYGIWLDRGELERLIARARDEFDELERRESRASRPEPRDEPRHEAGYEQRHEPRRDRRDDDRDRFRREGRDGRHYGHRKKRWFETLGDIFD